MWPRYVSSLFQLMSNRKLWSSESFILYETLPYDYSFKLLIQSVLFLLYSFCLPFVFLPFLARSFSYTLHAADTVLKSCLMIWGRDSVVVGHDWAMARNSSILDL